MPHHWWVVDPDNPGPRQRARAVYGAAQEAGGTVIAVGYTRKGTWFALVDIPDDEDEDRVYKAIGGRGKLFKLTAVEPDGETQSTPPGGPGQEAS